MPDEMPPDWMWPFDEELEIHFELVEEARKAKYGGGESEESEGGMMVNELARGKK